MKFLKSSLFVLIVFATALNIQSCKDECDTVVCQNGGSCEEGICACPDGFSGANCETKEDDEAPDLCLDITCENGGTCLDGNCDCPKGYIGTNCENFDPTEVQVLLDSGKTPEALLNGGIPLDSLYGKLYEGGFIFYYNETNGTGMVAATTENTAVPWGCSGTEIIAARGAELGDGQANTTAILASCTQVGIAAVLCDELVLDGKSDWFLPSKAELNLMYTNLHLKGHGGFAMDIYWSSTEVVSLGSWYQDFEDGDQLDYDKTFNTYVRAARDF